MRGMTRLRALLSAARGTRAAAPAPLDDRARFEPTYLAAFEDVLRRTFFAGWDPAYLDSPAGREDIHAHLTRRLAEHMDVLVPWVQRVQPLQDASVLEIGCGTGSSTAAFAKMAARHTCIEILGASIEAARRRCELLGIDNVDFMQVPHTWATDEASVDAALGTARFDVVLLIALLEHLTPIERINVLRATWSLLQPGGILVVYETPNRLTMRDWHTMEAELLDWLPDELAVQYMRRHGGPYNRETLDTATDPVTTLYRLGRGVSFHEFELAIGLDSFEVVGDSSQLAMRTGLAEPAHEARLLESFERLVPRPHPAFAHPSLDLILRKPG